MRGPGLGALGPGPGPGALGPGPGPRITGPGPGSAPGLGEDIRGPGPFSTGLGPWDPGLGPGAGPGLHRFNPRIRSAPVFGTSPLGNEVYLAESEKLASSSIISVQVYVGSMGARGPSTGPWPGAPGPFLGAGATEVSRAGPRAPALAPSKSLPAYLGCKKRVHS